MPGWDFSRYRSAVADCGPYRGPWPPSAPVWAALAKLTARFPYEDIALYYHTALGSPGGDPARFDDFDDPAERAVTHAAIGSTWSYDYSHYPTMPTAQQSWDAPSYWWDYDETPPFSLAPPRRPGIRLFVEISWNGTGIAEDEIIAAVGALSPLSLVPANFADGGSGPDAWPLGIWSDWYPPARTVSDLYDFNSSPASFDTTEHFTETYFGSGLGEDLTAAWHAAAAAAQEQLVAAVPELTRGDVGTQQQFSIVSSSTYAAPFPAGVQVALRAWQSAIALDVDAVPFPLDLYNTEPRGLEAAQTGPPPDYLDYRDPPYLWGSSDPYTIGGFGWQWEQREALRFLGLLDGANEGQLGFVLRQGSAPYIGEQPPPPCPMRVFAREYTGPATGWLAEDGDAYPLGTYTADALHGWWSDGYAFQWYGNQPEPFSGIPWRRFWVVCTPTFASPGGALPDIPAWSDPASWNFFGGGYGGYTAAYDSCYSNYYYYSDIHFSRLTVQGNYLHPRWRLYKPALSVLAPATRLSQRADGQGITPAVRLRGPNYPRSEQSDATRRVGARNTFA